MKAFGWCWSQHIVHALLALLPMRHIASSDDRGGNVTEASGALVDPPLDVPPLDAPPLDLPPLDLPPLDIPPPDDRPPDEVVEPPEPCALPAFPPEVVPPAPFWLPPELASEPPEPGPPSEAIPPLPAPPSLPAFSVSLLHALTVEQMITQAKPPQIVVVCCTVIPPFSSRPYLGPPASP